MLRRKRKPQCPKKTRFEYVSECISEKCTPKHIAHWDQFRAIAPIAPKELKGQLPRNPGRTFCETKLLEFRPVETGSKTRVYPGPGFARIEVKHGVCHIKYDRLSRTSAYGDVISKLDLHPIRRSTVCFKLFLYRVLGALNNLVNRCVESYSKRAKHYWNLILNARRNLTLGKFFKVFKTLVDHGLIADGRRKRDVWYPQQNTKHYLKDSALQRLFIRKGDPEGDLSECTAYVQHILSIPVAGRIVKTIRVKREFLTH